MRRRKREEAIDARIAALYAQVHADDTDAPAAVDDLDVRVAKALDDRDRARRAEVKRRELAASTDTPCCFCGNSRRIEDHARYDDACEPCDWRLRRRFDRPDMARDAAVAQLVGATEGDTPQGWGARLRWWSELPAGERRRDWRVPFGWISDETLAAWRDELIPTVTPQPSGPIVRRAGRAEVTVHSKHPPAPMGPTALAVVRHRRACW